MCHAKWLVSSCASVLASSWPTASARTCGMKGLWPNRPGKCGKRMQWNEVGEIWTHSTMIECHWWNMNIFNTSHYPLEYVWSTICLATFSMVLWSSMLLYNSSIVTLQQVVPNRRICFFESSKKNTLLISSHFIVIPFPFMKLTFLIGFRVCCLAGKSTNHQSLQWFAHLLQVWYCVHYQDESHGISINIRSIEGSLELNCWEGLVFVLGF